MGYAMAYEHGEAYRKLDTCEMVACADIVQENADAFATKFGIPRTYLNYREMLEKEKPDVVSICTWPKAPRRDGHRLRPGGREALPLRRSRWTSRFGGSRKMLQVAEQHGMHLNFNHQRRYGKPFRETKRLIDSGEIGSLVRMEANTWDLYDGGTPLGGHARLLQQRVPAKSG